MDGMSSTRAIRQFEDLHNIPQCLIVALTGLASASARLEALSSGVDKFITKPLNFRVLASLLEDPDETKRQRDEMREFRRMSKNDDVEETSNGTHETQEARFQQGNCKVELDMSVKQPESQQDVHNIPANGTYETHEAEVDLSVKQLQSTELEQKPGPTQEEQDPAYIRDHKHPEEVEPPVQHMTSESRRVDVAGEKEAHHEVNEIEPLGVVKEEHVQQDVEHRVEGQEPREGTAQPNVEKKESPSAAGDDERHHEMEPRTRTAPEEIEARPVLPDEH
jgi:CheY-like chemotaxis protein